MSWSSERRATYSGIFLLVALLVLGFLAYRFFYDAPTCSDGKQNSGEQGVDCGGSCEAVCRFNAVQPTVLWARFFEVSPGIYNALALLENPNLSAEASGVSYSFKLRDERTLLVVERVGFTDLPPERLVPIFEAGIETGERRPARVTFELDTVERWVVAPAPLKAVEITSRKFSGAPEPRLDAVVRNSNLASLADVELVAILSDESGNAIAASRTILPHLPPESETPIVFTWPAPFSAPVAVIEIIPKPPLAKGE